MKVAHVSTFPDMKCGIAFFASDLIQALPQLENRKYVLHYGECMTREAEDQADVTVPSDLKKLARSISQSDCDVISLQHEFGIWGGEHGEHILYFLDETSLPIVSTLHTTFPNNSRPAIRGALLGRIVARSDATIVLTRRSKDTLCALLDVPEHEIRVIPHGVPELPFEPIRVGHTEPHLISFGFFRPDKGLEVILQSLQMIKEMRIRFRYKIAGSAQPQFLEQKDYYREIEHLISNLNLAAHVELDGRFFTRGEQVRLIQNSHAAIFAYQDRTHASSGAVALALSAGRPVICTPFEYARAAEQETSGVHVAKDFGPDALFELLSNILQSRTEWNAMAKAAYKLTRAWTWPVVGKAFAAAFDDAAQKRIYGEHHARHIPRS